MKSVIIIPARFGSKRFPGKLLAKILGKPMILWVVEGAMQSQLAELVVVATDDGRIADAVKQHSVAEVVMTSPNCPSGSDRVAEAVEKLRLNCEIVVNLQGDEPLIEGAVIDQLIAALMDDANAEMATLVTNFENLDELRSPNTAKVVVNSEGYALYFSRSVIPYPRDGELRLDNYLKHIGIYAYRHEALQKFVSLPTSPLENIEKLEQLRALEAGMSIKVVKTDFKSVPVDVPADVAKAEQAILEKLKGRA